MMIVEFWWVVLQFIILYYGFLPHLSLFSSFSTTQDFASAQLNFEWPIADLDRPFGLVVAGLDGQLLPISSWPSGAGDT